MVPEILTLCEFASDHNGSLTIADTIDAIVATKFPWRAYFYIAARINIADCPTDYKSISMKIVSSDEAAKVIFETTSQFERPKDAGKISLVAGFKGLIFEKAGKYFFRIYLDNTIIGECTFMVIHKER